MVSGVLDCNILQLLYNGAHDLLRSSRWLRGIEDLQLLRLEKLSNNVHKRIRVFVSPEVNIQGVKAKEKFSFISRIGVW